MTIADLTYGDTENREACEANAERLVACWNACEGIEDPKTTISDMLEALQEALAMFGANADYSDDDKNAIDTIKSAIAKAKANNGI